ncbi:CBS domain containing membrane protein [Thioalkalivibrio nitratireducens DSM 14787]|uniref:CBS domain containing membrane protein n=1 Tax=Thioalkalivibrio nitratireducens (strain DSM 14787 / UNIQEM 213 / ALEN2) TaxID=1255043 RepID=L0DTT3_THIND|nr:CBS domain-containing protein [Thioalkalivibrio nitratireducens]AGA33014.1 CBS domain containing membrane protein [Thioalkalivibrio nitratireducens DSM 14787]
MKKVHEVLNEKGHDVYSIGPEASVFEALRMMADHEIGALPVLENGRLVGLISERDYARKVILLDRSSRNTPVREIMMARVTCVEPGRTVEECMALMTDKRVRHLPVLEHGKLVGLVSIGDLVKAIIDEQQFIISQLELYIAS